MDLWCSGAHDLPQCFGPRPHSWGFRRGSAVFGGAGCSRSCRLSDQRTVAILDALRSVLLLDHVTGHSFGHRRSFLLSQVSAKLPQQEPPVPTHSLRMRPQEAVPVRNLPEGLLPARQSEDAHQLQARRFFTQSEGRSEGLTRNFHKTKS